MLRTAWEGVAGHATPLQTKRSGLGFALVPPLLTFPASAAAIHYILAACGVHAFVPDDLAAVEEAFAPAAIVAAAVCGTALVLQLFAMASTHVERTRRMLAALAAMYLSYLLYLLGHLAGAPLFPSARPALKLQAPSKTLLLSAPCHARPRASWLNCQSGLTY
jgi:hypothetical protein